MVCLGLKPGAAEWKATDESTVLCRHPSLAHVFVVKIISFLKRPKMNEKDAHFKERVTRFFFTGGE